MITNITRRVEFDAGHRIPDHASKCKNIHGHRYVLEATVRGPVHVKRGRSDDGMVVDFGDLKAIMERTICDQWDHAFLVCGTDVAAIAACEAMGDGHKHVVLTFIPTVENLAAAAFQMLNLKLENTFAGSKFYLHHVRLYETPNCWADVFDADHEAANR